MLTDNVTTVLLVIAGVLLGGIGLFALIDWWRAFRSELDYINSEIERTDGEEQQYWVRQRRRLWASLLPFVKC